MGRSKSKPVRKSTVTDDDAVVLLGRTTLQNGASVDQLLALEIQQDQQRQAATASSAARRKRDDDDDARDDGVNATSRLRTKKRKVRFAEEEEEETVEAKGLVDDDSVVSFVSNTPPPLLLQRRPHNKSRLQAVLARIEKEHAEKASSRSKQKRRRRQTQQRKRAVSFADDQKLVSIIPKPEIQVHQTSDEKIILRYCASSTIVSVASNSSTLEDVWCLGEYEFVLPFQIVMEPDDDDDDDQKMPSSPLPITTRQGAMDVWKLVGNVAANSSLGCITSPSESTSAIGRAVQERALLFHIVPTNDNGKKLRVSITRRALTIGNQVPLHNRRLTGKKYQSFYTVQSALAALFPALADIIPSPSKQSSSSTVVTAKQVYALTDNVQLKAALQQEDSHHQSPPLSIPGLVPKLRPYQEKAVQWMLQREHSSISGNDEWELAWFVLGGGGRDAAESLTTTTLPQPVPLPQWRDRTPSNDIVLFCPFTGWLAESIEQARAMTAPTATCPTKGGILAESMGLGKSVEVLACILAHPKPREQLISQQSKTVVPHAAVKRQLVFGEEVTDNRRLVATQSNTEPVPKKVGVVGDMNDFCDTDNSDDDNDDDDDDDAGQITESNGSEHPSGTLQSSSAAVLVTPIKDVTKEPVEERWTDEETLGSCICGDLIGFSTGNNSKSGCVVICGSCEEPMHMRCAAFHSEDEMKRQTKPLRFMQTFSNQVLDCHICEKSRCPCCVEKQQSGATLIITPPAILNQWEREIQRHTRTDDGKSLRVIVYEGIKRLSQDSTAKNRNGIELMHPARLADADIVLMTFDALMADLGHSDDNRYIDCEGNLRKRKLYRVVPSPLQSINWWRVCLDESQRVEVPTAGSAQMALKLETDHRWCVTGTPIGRGKLDDLFGLLLFLRLDPFCNKLWFRKCFSSTSGNIDERIEHLLKNVFWRSTKSFDLVREQMGVPEQIERKVLLQFSSIERHFYDRQLEQTLSAAGDVVDSKGNKRNKTSSHLHLLAEQLHKLRAACCHPQVGSSGIGSIKKSRTTAKRDAGLSSRVMTMSQILDKFIDDAKIQCEEALRLAVLHNNGMACLSKLKVEAKERGVDINESDRSLLEQSCKLYLQSLRLADENATPALVMGEATLSGSVGFRSPQKAVLNCDVTMDWKWQGISHMREAWSKCDFTFGPARKITQLRVCVVRKVPSDLIEQASESLVWHVLYPKDCVFQCSSMGGEFVDVHAFSLPHPDESFGNSILENGFRTNKSKSWRLVVKSFHSNQTGMVGGDDEAQCSSYLGLNVQFYEASIASDPLQRLHCLHNASLSFSSLLQVQENGNDVEKIIDGLFTAEEMRERIDSMTAEAKKIESLYLDAARAIHNNFHRRLLEASKTREDQETDLLNLTQAQGNGEPADCWDDSWWDDFLVICRLHGSEAQQLAVCDRLLADLDSVVQGGLEGMDRGGVVPFPVFRDINGLRTALQMRVYAIRSGLGNNPSRRTVQRKSVVRNEEQEDGPIVRDGRFKCEPGGHAKCMKSILDLTPNPTDGEMLENSRCKVCKADWFQTGPKCRHCKIGEDLEDLVPDRVTMLVLRSLYSLMKSGLGNSLLKSVKTAANVDHRAEKFFEVLDAEKRERVFAWRLWRTHLDLLNDIDELNQCKSAMRLTFEGEDVTELSEDQLNAVVVPVDVSARYHDHAAKQAMALGTLSRSKGTLQYLKNQSAAANQHSEATDDTTEQDKKEETCIVCLSTFDTNRAVLRCGHSFHLSPCLEKLQSRSGGAQNLICCPLRCRIRTEPRDVMIASEKRHDDGSRSKRSIKGSFGTKVTRLVSDILDVSDLGDKSLVFSQWDDMLDICEQALAENGVNFVRVASVRQMGECTKQFRSPDCFVMLLNVKNGAEGLTLLEASHVFMVEPLLNCGLDSQAINRVHRIGQNRKTYVWRYLVRDTIEVKIDKLRMDHQEDQLEDSISDGKKSAIKAGGIDGGFHSQEELLDILKVDGA